MTNGGLAALAGSFVVVALAEMGDKTQLIAFSLASRYRRPWVVMLGILLATLANHALAASVGVWLAATVSERVLAIVLGLGFLAFGVWTLFPNRAPELREQRRWGPLASTAAAFFLAEMGDKTQLATVALAARYGAPVAVTAGTTAGMLVSDGLAVFAGTWLGDVVPMGLIRAVAATLFFLYGAAAFGRAAGLFG